jgi:hypothetical protein
VGKSSGTKAQSSVLDALIFVDTNIYLDFYRVRGKDAGLSVLAQLGNHLDRLIVTSQVEMEFMKNRQTAILESHRAAKGPDWSGANVPSFLLDSKPSKAFETAKKQVNAQVERMKKRIARMLTSPATQDPVYQAVRPLFRTTSSYCLSRGHDARDRIRRLALKRFGLGYPPRKSSDTSIGDAINWEWIVRCAEESGKHIIVVSRDSDYGASFQGTPVLNDWLRQEFSERVSQKRKLLLTDRLTEAFRRVAIPVTEKEVQQEKALLEQNKAPSLLQPLAVRMKAVLSPEEYAVMEVAAGLVDDTPKNPDQVAALLGLPRHQVIETFLGAVDKLEKGGHLATDGSA